MRMVEVKRLRHDPGGAATEVPVRQPRRVERVRGVRRTSTVDAIRQTFQYQKLNILNKRNEVLRVLLSVCEDAYHMGMKKNGEDWWKWWCRR